MRYLPVILNIFFALALKSTVANAQQAKAYEYIRYSAKTGTTVFRLHYADGYIGASKISVTGPQQKTKLFRPESGTTESNGDLIFLPASNTDTTIMILKAIDEEVIAPKTISATYRSQGRTVRLQFIRVKK